MSTNFILAPILTHMITAVILLLFWQRTRVQRIISVIGNSIAFIMCVRLFDATREHGGLLLNGGQWPAPFRITVVSDSFSSVMVILTALVSLAVGIYATASLNPSRIQYGYFFLFH